LLFVSLSLEFRIVQETTLRLELTLFDGLR
jgi:hypothetical protein